MAFRLSSLPAVVALVCLVAPLLGAAAAAPARLEAVRVERSGTATLLQLDLSRATTHKFFMLDGPRRAVIDLRQTRAAPSLRWPDAADGIRGVRGGARPGDVLRVVVELDGHAPVRVRKASAGARAGLVLEIGAGADAPRAAPAAAAAAAAVVASAPAVSAAPATTRADEPARPIRAAHAPAESGRPVIIAIDAGHGGVDPGAIGKRGTREKDVVLAIARELAARINREPGMRAVLTRDGDYFLPHRQRMAKARAAKADMFLSVHADSVGNSSVSGSSVYILSTKGASDEQARWLAERENAADLKGGISLDDKDNTLASVLLDLSQSASITASMEAAERVLRRLNTVNEVRKPRVQQAGFLVLKSPDIPSMLVETAFISNPGDERRLGQDEYRERLAEAIFRGVHGYFEDYPPEGTLFAARRRAADPPTASNRP